MDIVSNVVCYFSSNHRECKSNKNKMSRPKSTHSTLSHVTETTEKSQITARAEPVTPAHKSWTAYRGPVIFTGML